MRMEWTSPRTTAFIHTLDVVAELDVPDDLGRRVDVDALAHPRPGAFVGTQHALSRKPSVYVRPTSPAKGRRRLSSLTYTQRPFSSFGGRESKKGLTASGRGPQRARSVSACFQRASAFRHCPSRRWMNGMSRSVSVCAVRSRKTSSIGS